VRGIRGRLLLATGAVVLAALGAVGFLASRASRREFQKIEVVLIDGGKGPPVERRLRESGRSGQTSAFESSVDRGIFGAVLVAGAASLAGVFLVSRRILGPIGRLTEAAERLAAGDLRARVAAAGRDEIGTLANAFNGMASSLLRLEEARKRMVSDAAHEIRSPLTNLKAQLEAIEDGLVRPDPATIASLTAEVNALGRLVDDLRDLAQADAGGMRLDRRPTPLPESVAAALAAVRPRAEAGGVALVSDVPDDVSPVFADGRRLAQIFRNLLANALDHARAGDAITVAAHADGAFARISVADTGPGIPAEHVPHVFERFYRADAARARTDGGSGLGLAIVRDLVRAHGGEVAIQSEPERGTVVRFSLPFIENS